MKHLYLMSLLVGASAMSMSAADVYVIELKCPTPPSLIAVDKPFAVDFTVQNFDYAASGDVNSFTITFTPENGTPSSSRVYLDEPLTGTLRNITVGGFVCDVFGTDIKGTFTLSEVNGEDKPQIGKPVEVTLTSAYASYPRGVVFEEKTGSWCQYCYTAYLAMEYMWEKYKKEGFIGFAAHVADSYACSASNQIDARISSGYPSGAWDRNYGQVVTPTQSGLEGYYKRQRATNSPVGIDVSFELPETGNILDLTTTISFGLPMSGVSYELSYMLTEGDLIGNQNSTSGYYPVKYNDVVRYGSIYEGRPVTEIPSEVEALAEFPVNAQVDLSDLTNRNNSYISVLLLDAKTGRVVNATRQPLNGERWDPWGESGVETIAVSKPVVESGEAVYYDLQGRCIAAEPTTPGVYVRRTGDKAEKILIK